MTERPLSVVKGRRQSAALRGVVIVALVLAEMGMLSDRAPFRIAGVLAISLVTATPLLRVGWLVIRWVQERDWRFVWTGVALIAVIAVAGVVALVGQ